jgi:hypothetical protein
MKKAALGVVYDVALRSLLIPIEDGEKALRISLRDPTIPKGIRDWVAENFPALVDLVRALSSAKETWMGTWIRVPIDGEWMFV